MTGHLRDLRDLLADGDRAAPGVVVEDMRRAYDGLVAASGDERS